MDSFLKRTPKPSINNDSISEEFPIKEYTIGGVKILFPYKPYPSQITMINKIVRCLNKKENCLLESPTGSGKSLALLCATLAWQKKIKKEMDELEAQLESELGACGITVPDTPAKEKRTQSESTMDVKNGCNKCEFKCCDSGVSKTIECNVPNSKYDETENTKRGIIYIDDLEDFRPAKKYRCSTGSSLKMDSETSPPTNSTITNEQYINVEKVENLVANEAGISDSGCADSPNSEKNSAKMMQNSSLPTKLPKIYFGTRTHKQIDQIIRELKKTPYRDSQMTILSSRDRTCIHPEVSVADNKAEACEELLKADGHPACRFFRKSKTISHFQPSKLSTAFDLEDFVSICRKSSACPYYSSRELLPSSDIVFCPYNYLVDPRIRAALSIQLKNCIVIMDEAHNIEDAAREAASGSFTLSKLEGSVLNLQRVGKQSKKIPDCYLYIAKILSNLVSWLKANIDNLTDYSTFDSSTKVWAGDDMIAILNYVELGPNAFPEFKKKFDEILAVEEDSQENEPKDMDEIKMLGSTVMFLKDLTTTLTYLYKNNLIFLPDYRCSIVKSQIYAPRSRRKSYVANSSYEVTLNFWCFNPGVAFSDLNGVTHSVIVASGTLSPLGTFQGELMMTFHSTLEANHVVASNRMWVGTIGRGPSNRTLTATYQNAMTFEFQDDIGSLVCQVCNVIPHGILCFLPSYSMLDNLVSRWKQTGIWDSLQSKKVVLCEPRRQQNFLTVINDFYAAVKESSSDSECAFDGALLLAVCRGKVSEGLDFADNNARAVITIGIPFPNIKDAQVDLKREYNDLYSSKKSIMTGSEWYEIQAFRALNQALGRCIRHRDDFGALIIVDERFQKNNRYPNALSKWIRSEIVHHRSFPEALNSLNSFAERTGLKAVLQK